MSTRVVGLPGIHTGNLSPAAGIRPFQLDPVYAAASSFLSAKAEGTGGQVTSAVSAGDHFVNSGNNYSQDAHNGTQWLQRGAVVTITVAGATLASAGADLALGTIVAAPGANRVVIPRAIFGSLASGTAWTDGSPLVVSYGGTGGASATANITSAHIDADATTQSYFHIAPAAITGVPATSCANVALVLSRVGSVAATTNARALTLNVVYDILQLV